LFKKIEQIIVKSHIVEICHEIDLNAKNHFCFEVRSKSKIIFAFRLIYFNLNNNLIDFAVGAI
jgi:hypothetical protein